jgi:hypothetical protein
MRYRTRRSLITENKKLSLIIDGLGNQIGRMTPSFRKSPYCATHESIAACQQVKGGNYVWKEYCNYYVRDECDVA